MRGATDALNPVWAPSGAAIFYLGERGGTLNVWKRDLNTNQDTQLTQFSGEPVRSLSSSRAGDLAFTQGGKLYLLRASQ